MPAPQAPGATLYKPRPSMGVITTDASGRVTSERKEIMRGGRVKSIAGTGYEEVSYVYYGGKQYVATSKQFSYEGVPTFSETFGYATSKSGARVSSVSQQRFEGGQPSYSVRYADMLGTVRHTTYSVGGLEPKSVTIKTRTPEKETASDKAYRDALNLKQESEAAYRQRSAVSEQEYTRDFYNRQYEQRYTEVAAQIKTDFGVNAYGADPALFNMLSRSVARDNEAIISKGNFMRTTGEVEQRNDIAIYMGLSARRTPSGILSTGRTDSGMQVGVPQDQNVGVLTAAAPSDWFETTIGTYKISQIRAGEGSFAGAAYGAGAFGLGVVQGFTFPFIHPIETAKGMWQMVTSPKETFNAFSQQIGVYPEYTAGQVAGGLLLSKSIKTIRPVGRVSAYAQTFSSDYTPIASTGIKYVESFTTPMKYGEYVKTAGKTVDTIHVTQKPFEFTPQGKITIIKSTPGNAGKFRSQRGLFEFYSSTPEAGTGKPQAYLGYTDIAPGEPGRTALRFT